MTARFRFRVISWPKSFPEAASVAVICVGGVVLIGWMLNIATLKSILPGLVTMKANTALAFFLAGVSLWLLRAGAAQPVVQRRQRRMAQVCAFIVALVGLLTLAEYLFGRDLGIDQLLFQEISAAVETSSPGRMAPNTALSLVLVGLALLLLDVETRRGHRPAQFLALAAGFVSMLALTGYAYGSTSFYGISSYTRMALHTAATFLVLCAGVCSVRPDTQLMRILTSDTAGGLVARRLLPAAVFIPLVLGWLRLVGQRAGLYDTKFGSALFALSNILVFTVLIWWNANLLFRTDTERKRAEEAVKISGQRLNLALDSAQMGIWELDLVNDTAFRNLRHDQIFGYQSLQPEWGYEIFLTHVVPEDRDAVKERFEEAFATGNFSMECRIIWSDRSIHWISAQGRVFRDDKGNLVKMMGSVTDVTERKQAEEAIVRAKEEAERASRFKDQFLSTMSHELRTPLNAILGFSELLPDERYGTLNERQRRYIRNIHTSGQHLLSLINDILDLSKIEAGRLELAIESVQVETAFREVLGALRPLADKKSQTLSQHAETGLSVRADATRFKQVLMNLLGNAIKFTPEGGRIDLAARLMDGQVRVDVRDTGPGIPPEEQKRIFEAFYRLRQSAKATEGTGLGLAITQRLVELHGGQLGLESQPGQGSCFYFSLPVALAVREPLTPEIKSRPRASEPPRILVIEDDPAAGQLIELQLTSSGYEVVVCDQPQHAVEIAAELQPNAITLDLLMKPANGWEVLVQLKRDPRTASIPVIVITIVDQPAMGAILGADEYLVKPVDKVALLAAVERCLGTQGVAPPARPILVVEDDAPTREVIVELLTRQGYLVATAADGAQARAWVAASLPELVILDLLLPEVSGFELLAEWRANPRTADLPVFVLTSKDLSREEEKYLRAHAEYLFHKQQPWQETLVKQLQRVAAQSQMEKA